MTFLPPNSEEPQKPSDYTKFAENSTTKLRIFDSAITGTRYWVKGEGPNNKPVRVKEMLEVVPPEAVPDKYGRYMFYFWAFKVYNYDLGMMQICDVHQSSIKDGIESYINQEEYGEPTSYDIKIVRDDSGDIVQYDVIALPPTDVSLEAANAYAAKPINLEALFAGGNPFEEAKVKPEDIPS